jgi:hypothetical protein
MGGWRHGIVGTNEEGEKEDKQGVQSQKSEAEAPEIVHDTLSSSSPSSSSFSSSSLQHHMEGADQEDEDEMIQKLTRPLHGHSPTRGTLEDLLRKRKSVSCPLSTPLMPTNIHFEVPRCVLLLPASPVKLSSIQDSRKYFDSFESLSRGMCFLNPKPLTLNP